MDPIDLVLGFSVRIVKLDVDLNGDTYISDVDQYYFT